MIIYPSGTVVVKKVDGNDNFIEDSLDYFDLQQTLSSNVVTITGSQTVSGQKTFNQDLIAPAVESITGDLELRASGTNSVKLSTNDVVHLEVNEFGELLHKSHANFTG